jgi:hypothetical protein
MVYQSLGCQRAARWTTRTEPRDPRRRFARAVAFALVPSIAGVLLRLLQRGLTRAVTAVASCSRRSRSARCTWIDARAIRERARRLSRRSRIWRAHERRSTVIS